MTDQTLDELIELAWRDHSHLCPRQVLGVRMGLAGLQALGFEAPPEGKRLLVITESDGCFADSLSAATGCTVGHRTLRVEDYGKTAAVFVDTHTGGAVRLTQAPGLRERAGAYAPGEARRYFAQLQAYRIMPAEEMFACQEVRLKTPVEALVSRPKVRTNCARCGEEIINERQVRLEGEDLCRTCAGGGYYEPAGLPASGGA